MLDDAIRKNNVSGQTIVQTIPKKNLLNKPDANMTDKARPRKAQFAVRPGRNCRNGRRRNSRQDMGKFKLRQIGKSKLFGHRRHMLLVFNENIVHREAQQMATALGMMLQIGTYKIGGMRLHVFGRRRMPMNATAGTESNLLYAG